MFPRVLTHTAILAMLLFCWTLPGYSQGFNNLKNLAVEAEVEAEGADIPAANINDEDFNTRWNAKNDDVDTWIQFKWKNPQKINRVHVTEFRSRIRGHTIEYGDPLKEVVELVMEPENADASPNHPGNQREPVKIPDHVITFKTIETTILRYHITETVDPASEPSLWEVEIFFDPEAAPVRPVSGLTTLWAKIKTEKRGLKND